MTDPAREAFFRCGAEPYRTKVVERLTLPNREERARAYEAAFHSPAHLDAKDVWVDLVTDSGTGAMSDEQWAALMRGDEAYVRSKSFAPFERAVQRRTGFDHVVPTHQGRAAEKILMELLVKPGDMVLANTHFDTTAANVQARGATPLDLVSDGFWTFSESAPFKGNFDLERLAIALERHHDRVPLIVVTVVNNFAGSSPVSMENVREVRRLADRYGIPVFIDACRFAENAWFIQQREPGYADKSVAEIALELFSHAHGCWMSAKKDALVNIGGFIATSDQALTRRCQERLVLYEGFYTYGGLAGRDLEAVAVGLEEAVDEDYLRHRTSQVAFLGERLRAAGAVVSLPTGGSSVFVDVQAMYPHLAPAELPGIALCADFYLEGGVRVGALPFRTKTIDPRSGTVIERALTVARFAIPRRVYGKAHFEYVGAIAARVVEGARHNRGYRVVEYPDVLGHFFAKFQPLAA